MQVYNVYSCPFYIGINNKLIIQFDKMVKIWGIAVKYVLILLIFINNIIIITLGTFKNKTLWLHDINTKR